MPLPEDDLASLLPEPPPPRPARREEAIAAAMRRFDGVEEPAPAKPAARPAWGGIGKQQIGVFASIALVAMIGIPIALQMPRHPTPTPTQQTAPVAERSTAPGTVPPAGPAPVPALAQQDSAAVAVPGAAPPGAAHVGTAKPAAPTEEALPPPPPPAPPPPPPPPPVEVAPDNSYSAGFAQGGALRAPPPDAKRAARAAPAPDSSIVVTARRRDERLQAAPSVVDSITAEDIGRFPDSDAMNRRGVWNACTVDDPARSLRGCRHLVNPEAKGVAGAADKHVEEGLQLAWNGDLTGAIAAFDKAIALRPKLAFALLNRGMVWRRKGDLETAADDLDLAIRYAPNDARGYFQRSLVRRQQDNERAADADLNRAISRDERYEALTK